MLDAFTARHISVKDGRECVVQFDDCRTEAWCQTTGDR
jgi:hypothetical protein